jgi:hypothetical protein
MACRIATYQIEIEIEIEINRTFVRANKVELLQESRKKLERVIGLVNVPPLEAMRRWMIGS